jgi:uracil-DNA glycosylase family 4
VHCQKVAEVKRRAYQNEKYWGKPVPNFGTPKVSLLVVGLAPGAHGANRTGRMFTGDRSGDWLYRALFQAGFANQPSSAKIRDGLKLIDAAITNIGRCAPPDNKPASTELANCQPFFLRTLQLANPVAILALGGLAWKQTIKSMVALEQIEKPRKMPKFGHGEKFKLSGSQTLFASYHPSQQNTFTGRLTEKMFDQVFGDIKKTIAASKK